MSEEQDHAKRQCVPKKCASIRRTPIEGTLTEFLDKHGSSKEEWDAGELNDKGITEFPPLLPLSQVLKVLTKLNLSKSYPIALC